MKKIVLSLSLILLGCTDKQQLSTEFQPEYFQSACLEADFTTPPDYAKPHVYWWWLEGFITKGILSDLFKMKKTISK